MQLEKSSLNKRHSIAITFKLMYTLRPHCIYLISFCRATSNPVPIQQNGKLNVNSYSRYKIFLFFRTSNFLNFKINFKPIYHFIEKDTGQSLAIQVVH